MQRLGHPLVGKPRQGRHFSTKPSRRTMENVQQHQRPSFDEAIQQWQATLAQYGLPTSLEWVLDENLVFEKDAAAASGVRLGFQTRFTQRPEDLARATYDFFSDFDARLVFYRLGTSGGKSVCLLLCDPVFETRGEPEGFIRHDAWLISFRPGPNSAIEEITEEKRWKNRLIGGRPLSDVDFCLPLEVLRELEVHGRALTPYERFGVKVLPAYERWQRSSES
jgi:hypothetical protein